MSSRNLLLLLPLPAKNLGSSRVQSQVCRFCSLLLLTSSPPDYPLLHRGLKYGAGTPASVIGYWLCNRLVHLPGPLDSFIYSLSGILWVSLNVSVIWVISEGSVCYALPNYFRTYLQCILRKYAHGTSRSLVLLLKTPTSCCVSVSTTFPNPFFELTCK